MRSIQIICFLFVVLASCDATIFQMVPNSFGQKAYEIDTSDKYRIKHEEDLQAKSQPNLVEEVLKTTKIIEGREGCTWSRFTSLLDLLRKDKYPIPILVKIAIAKQFSACDNKVIDLPLDDGLDSNLRDQLTRFKSKIDKDHEFSPKTYAAAALSFMKENGVNMKDLAKKSKKEGELIFRETFFREMDFCFEVDRRLSHYYEFIDQVARPTTNLESAFPIIADRFRLGRVCRIFANNNPEVVKIAFKKTMGKWYNFKHAMKEIEKEDHRWDE